MTASRSRPALLAGLAGVAVMLAACSTTPSPSEEAGGQASETASQTQDPASDAASASAAASEGASAAASEAAGEEARVRLTGFAFEPTELTIATGTEVSFANADSAPHTVTHGTDGEATDDPIIDEELDQNGATSFAFDEAGTYDITCRLHPSMNMTIVVE